MKIKAVVFDLDGTLLNTLEHVVQAFERVMIEHDVHPTKEQLVAAIGPPLIDCYKALLPDHDAEKAADRHHELQQTAEFLDLIQEYEHLRTTLDSLHAAHIRTAIFTNRWRRGVDMIFQRIDLAKEFEVIVTPESVKHGKPDPEGLRLIAKELRLKPTELAMVGDLPVDIQTGKRGQAGMTIGVTHGFGTREVLNSAEADHVIDSLDQILTLLGVSSVH